jgi:predicted nucleic acid-binding protein
MIFDSNIVIEAVKSTEDSLRELVERFAPSVSAVTRVEVLGFTRLAEDDRRDFEEFFAAATILPIDNDVIEQAIALRQRRKMGLGDALIAATALVHELALVTRNVKDFRWIEGLDLVDPSTTESPGSGEATSES